MLEDAYGTFETYKAIERQHPKANRILLAAPWCHGGWVRGDIQQFEDIESGFGRPKSIDYQKNLELSFFNYHLKEREQFKGIEANIFITGSNQWNTFDTWQQKNTETKQLYFQPNGKLSFDKEQKTNLWGRIFE